MDHSSSLFGLRLRPFVKRQSIKSTETLRNKMYKIFPNAKLYMVYASTEFDLISTSFEGLKANSVGQVNYNYGIKVK